MPVHHTTHTTTHTAHPAAAPSAPKKTHTFARHVAPFAPAALGLLMTMSPSKTADHQPTLPAAVSEVGGFGQSCTSPHFPQAEPGPIDGTSCTVVGNGGAESSQNTAKNNFCATGSPNAPNTPIQTTMAEMLQLQTQAEKIPGIKFGNTREHPRTSEAGPMEDRSGLQKLGEGQLVQLVGFVKVARQEGAESVNCGSHVPNDPGFHDIHISIVLSPADPECAGIVAEFSPHHRPAEWTAALVNQVRDEKLLVRITGQRMFDSSHSPCTSSSGPAISGDPSRSSLWEVHPLYNFEVCPNANSNCANGGWVPLEAWKKS